MYFSTYRKVTVILYVGLMAPLTWLAFVLAPAFGVIFLLVMSLLGVIGIWLTFTLTRARLDDFGGRIPMPNAGLGMWGIDIVDDDFVGDPYEEYSDASIDYDSHELTPSTPALHCPFCHAVLGKPGARFCNDCGKPLASLPPSVS